MVAICQSKGHLGHNSQVDNELRINWLIYTKLIDILMYCGKLGVMNEGGEKRAWVALVQQQVEKTEFGVVQIVIHDSRVVRIERTEKLLVAEGATEVRGGAR